MAKFQPKLETCPICGSTGNCHIHDYYGRSIIDFRNGKRQKSDLCVMRVFCDSCEHAHAILPDDMDSAFILFENQKFPIRRTNRNENCHTKRSNPAIDYLNILVSGNLDSGILETDILEDGNSLIGLFTTYQVVRYCQAQSRFAVL